jgi:ATP-dependent RNA helicase DeaD
MVRWAKLNIRRGTIPSLDEVEEARTSVFFEKIRATLEAKQFKPHDRMIDRLLDQGYASTDICSVLIHMLQNSSSSAAPAKPAKAPAKPAFGSPAPSTPAPKTAKAAPTWAKPVAAPKAVEAPASVAEETKISGDDDDTRPRKSKYERAARTGREPGMATIFLNVGRKDLVTPADIVGKIAGVTRLPASVVGAIDIHQRHVLVDVTAEHAAVIVEKLAGIKLKGASLEPSMADAVPKE